jgi:alkylation response protein AidB-like acyl-CoA dehydrogenase
MSPTSDLLHRDDLAFRAQARAFVRERILPRAGEIDRHDEVPEDVFAALHPYLLLTAPEKYGGGGKPEMHACLLAEEVGYACPALVPYLEVGQLFGKALEIAGSEAQRQRYLGRIAAGELGAYALTDAGPGSDPVAMVTEAERHGERWRIHGKKRHITFFDRAKIMVLFARQRGAEGGRALSAFVLEAPFHGVRVERRSEWTGLRGHKAWDLVLEGAEATDVIGEPGTGLRTALAVLNHTRISLACGHVGLAQASLDLARSFVQSRSAGGRPIWQHQAVGFALVEAQARVDGARLLAYRAARAADEGEPSRAATSMAKFAAAEALLEAVSTCNRVLGGFGGHVDYAAERHLRDAFSWVAAQGTIEVQKLTVARELFGG